MYVFQEGRGLLYWLVCQLTETSLMERKWTIDEELSPPDWPVSKSVGHFSWLMNSWWNRAQPTLGSASWETGPGFYKTCCSTSHRRTLSSFPPSFLPLLLFKCLLWLPTMLAWDWDIISSLSCFWSLYHSHKEAIEHTQLGYLSIVQKTKYPEHLFTQESPGIPFTKSVRQE